MRADPASWIESVGVFPFPARNWFALEGIYQLRLRATCGRGPCPAGPA